MKNSFFKIFFLLSIVFGFFSSFVSAESLSSLNTIRLVEIKAEYYPNETYYLGYSENPDHSISSIFYENNANQKRFFTFSELSNDVPIIQTTSGGTVYDLVRLMVRESSEHGHYDVSMSYMRNGLFKNRKTAGFKLEFNHHRQVYELKDSKTNQLMTRTYVTTNFWCSKAVGIAEIISLR